MTSEFEGIKTNEFLRRRKLRLQQVREQSKDIAKKIRQRAKVEKLRQVSEVDLKKEQEYLQHQEKLVKRLEVLYAKGVKSVGAGHKEAADLTDVSPEKLDLSKQRGREAAAELRKKKQALLDEQKKLLDRKLQAREVANEISREKSGNVANKILTKASNATVNEQSKDKCPNDENVEDLDNNPGREAVTQTDMATQWDVNVMPSEWEPSVPALSLPRDDSEKDSLNVNNAENKSDKSRRLDLFALSEEMPSSLRGGLTNIPEERVTLKPSFTQVSEYLQSRKLRLRETEKVANKPVGDLQSLKQTILRARPTRNEGSDVCHVLDEQVIPVPCWQAESNCHFCSHRISHHHEATEITVTNSQINKIFSSIRSTRDIQPSPVLRGSSPFRRDKVSQKLSVKGNPREKSPHSSMATSSGIPKRNSVTVYNHSTRDSRNIPCGDEQLVFHNAHKEEDAYAQAMKEGAANDAKEKEHQHRLQEMRSKIAMTKQNVEKEYNDTLSFLNSLPKEKGSKTVKTAFMDERCEKMLKDSRQHKLQQEFRKIEKECKKHGPRISKRSLSENNRHRSNSPENGDNIESRDFQYSWMPVPESDGSLAIHTIPNTKPKSGNNVKFSKVDSYHEYRSRHKHTPPTKDKDQEKPKTVIETVLIQNGTESSDSSSDTSSVENLNLSQKKSKKKPDKELTEAERIIIYKVLETKKKDKAKKQAKLINSISKSLHSINKEKNSNEEAIANNDRVQNRVSIEHIQEGIYKTTKEKGDNITSLYFTDNSGERRTISLSKDEITYGNPCQCHLLDKDQQRNTGTNIRWEKGDKEKNVCDQNCCSGCKCACVCSTKPVQYAVPPTPQPSVATSTSSFKTATNDKENPACPEGGIVKLIDDEGQEAGKFYIGASGFLKDDDYEVIIQLRKKDSVKEEKKPESQADKLYPIQESQQTEESTSIKKCDCICDCDCKIGTKNEVPVDSQSRNKPVDIAEEATQAVPDIPPSEEVTKQRISTEQPLQNKEENTISGTKVSEAVQNIEEGQENILVDKCVCTSFNLSYAVPNHIAKEDPPSSPKTSASTYTQTTFNSTNTRPPYIHMSSSTSTAYMSPPEVVLPRYFRRDSDEDTNKAYNNEFGKFENHYEDRASEKYFSRKTSTEKINLPTKTKKMLRCLKTNIPTPPNTCRSYNTSISEMPCNDNSCNKRNIPFRKCRKCECNSDSVKDHKSQGRKSSRLTTTKKRTVLPKHTIASATSSSKHTWNVKKKDNSTSTTFNPVIKNYVNKLLSLNREGIKVLEVVDQECSTVATPGSSIIDVPQNTGKEKACAEPKLSLEQIKNEFIKKILSEYININRTEEERQGKTEQNHVHIKVSAARLNKKRSIHKVKSLNISKRLLKKSADIKKSSHTCVPLPLPIPQRPLDVSIKNVEKGRSRSSPTPRQNLNLDYRRKSDASDLDTTKYSKRPTRNEQRVDKNQDCRQSNSKVCIPQHRASSATLGAAPVSLRDIPVGTDTQEVCNAISTQTSRHTNDDPNYVKLAENKLENMEKIADLTEQCTQRLSNLAKVLEEVRRNKSLAYSQTSTSDSTSDVDQRSDKNNRNPEPSIDFVDVQSKLNLKPSTPALTSESEEGETLDSSKYISFLTDIPKPLFTKSLQSEVEVPSDITVNDATKPRTKPPPALSRMHLRNVQGITPHELSTVVEVDSPMSVRYKNQSSHTDNKFDSIETNINSNKELGVSPGGQLLKNNEEKIANPDLLQSDLTLSTRLQQRKLTTDSSDESKLQMIDLKQFNDIMLQPFISIQEYAKQYDMGTVDEASNLGDVLKDDVVNEDLSSMQSDSSLPDVIAELLKRKVITEPFKFDTVSNVHSTTGSSESSVLALRLSQVRKEKKKSTVMFQDKENVAESSDTLSFSSNPDLENAFKKLGMGWASSTLKKTKERLALSSSSNTSSSSVSQFKIKSLNNQDIPALVTDSVSTIMQLTKKEEKKDSKNNGQQANMSQSMTVKEFLTKELADKITFTNKSRRNDTEEEFVSLFETKMPEEMKHSSQMIGEERSIDSGLGNRARTSTPVQIFKSMTYHSSSSSNVSNGLFSNADDLSSVKVTSNSIRNHSTSDKDDLTIPNCSLRIKKASDASKSD
ncbi:uncharacterized protein LOC128669674 isoform X2 [Plodia interpunctella]|uniref:uncharacterized protein LOC128669674 isoform X2 n=1 Tax=Plodia interpunctella TaxID=58824 RepID=UPI002368A764|nr:uncharacterized protein LOC128669674 isoform X2 [Plodia interpunctella]